MMYQSESQNQLTSSTHLPVESESPHNATPRTGHDAATSICAYLIVHGGISRFRIAHAVGVPPLVIEECIRNNVSSATLRSQLRTWLYEISAASPAPKLRVPETLFRELQEDCAADELARQTQRRTEALVSPLASTPAVYETPFAALDPTSQQHFTQLRRSVGQSFISILNDPGEATGNANWSTWIGSRLYEVFDFNGRVGSLEEMLRSYVTAQTGPQTSAALLASDPLNLDFSGYVKLISETYQANRREGISQGAQEWREDNATDNFSDGELDGAATTADGGQWPTGVPEDFFASSYDPAAEVRFLSDAVEVPPLASPSPKVTTDGAPPAHLSSSTAAEAASSTAASPGVSLRLDSTTFAADFNYLESRNKELRAWESEVEKCLLQHVKRRSEDFFAASHHFGVLSDDAKIVLADARIAREGGMSAGEHFAAEYLRIGQLYRRRQNFLTLLLAANAAQLVLRRLGDVENWSALPERDMGEVLRISSALVKLENTIRGAENGEAGIPWASLSNLQCLAEVPGRVKRARKALEEVVLDEYCLLLLSGFGNVADDEGIGILCESVVRLGVVNAANHRYHEKVAEALQIAAQESLVSLLMNTDTLDDARANKLLAIAGNTATLALPDARQQLFEFAKHVPMQRFHLFAQQFSDVLVDFVTQVAQSWGFLLTGGMRAALSLYENGQALMKSSTTELLSRLCGEAESLIASLLEVYTNGQQINSVSDVLQLARVGVQFPQRVTRDPADQLALLLLEGASGGSHIASPCSTAPSPRATADPLGFLVYHPTKVIGITVQRFTKRYLRHQHELNKEKIAMVTEGESWVAQEIIDEATQRLVEEMCTMESDALRAFRWRSLRTVLTTEDGEADQAGPHRRFPSTISRFRTANGTSGGLDDELLSVGTNKLYVRVRHDRSGNGFLVSEEDSGGVHPSPPEPDGEEMEGRLVPGSLVVLMDLLHNYHEYMALFPFLAFDVGSRMIELLDFYEAKTAAMVLGARSVEKGMLSTITTQHLCVASQCVSFLIQFCPALQRHLQAALQGGDDTVAAQPPRALDTAVAVAHALGLVVTSAGTENGAVTIADKVKLLVENDWSRVLHNCRAHRNEYFSKMGFLVCRKVESLGGVSVEKGRWPVGGNEWVMTMLREVARLMRALRPLLPPDDVDGVIVPLLGSLSVMLREATARIPATREDDRAAAASDVMLFKANVEKFGYDVLKCADVTSVSTVMQGKRSFAPASDDDAVMRWFLPPAPANPTRLAPPAK